MSHFSGRAHYCRYRGVTDSGGRTFEARVPTNEEIAKLAYAYWEARGRQGGSAVEDWLRAERELRTRGSGPNA